ncbi:2-phospho-L-lactate guanylyltransferase [Stackebrandtia soli]|uniref:2-phospho-L-lactate guanylyltransferase n=1 Tax=Stackebrandtia soli TaxID=1892856 RepID=UPI0039E8EB1A
MPTSTPTWRLIIPVKRLDHAKTRLTPFAAPARARLALAFARDVIDAGRNCSEVRSVSVVTGDRRVATALPPDVVVIDEGPIAGLNTAITTAIATMDDSRIAVVTADLPAVTSDELATALRATARHERAYVPDLDGVGTVMLTARRAAELSPRFGPDSARTHLDNGHTRVGGNWPRLRRDVDTADQLTQAARLGVGAHTAVVLRELDGT